MRANWAHVYLYTKTEFNWIMLVPQWHTLYDFLGSILAICILLHKHSHITQKLYTIHVNQTRTYILIAVVNYCILCHIHNIMYSCCCCCYCGCTCIYPTTLLPFACCLYVSYQYISNAQNICCWAKRTSFIHSFMHLYRKVLLSM